MPKTITYQGCKYREAVSPSVAIPLQRTRMRLVEVQEGLSKIGEQLNAAVEGTDPKYWDEGDIVLAREMHKEVYELLRGVGPLGRSVRDFVGKYDLIQRDV